MTKAKKKWTAEELVERIRNRYAPQSHTVLEQVANGTGAGCSSWIDAVVISLWPSNGLWRAAMEVKVDRGDFLRELRDPAKNAWTRKYFHEFWFVAPAGVIKEEELPEGVGWLQPNGDGLKIVRHASRRDEVASDEMFVAAIARVVHTERMSLRRQIAAEIRRTDPQFLQAEICRVGVTRFLRSRNVYPTLDSPEAVVKDLTEATTGTGAREERQQILAVLDGFRDHMFRMLELFAQIAHHTLLDCDETGQRVIKLWHGVDVSGIDALRKAARGRKNTTAAPQARRRLALRALLEELAAEAPEKPEGKG